MPYDPLDTRVTVSRLHILASRGVLSATALERALIFADIIPSKQRWQNFLNTLLLVLGATFILAGIIFFFAYNWADMGRFLKFGVLQAAIVLAVWFAWYKGVQQLSGKLALLMAAVLVGPLLGVYGQTYQTGADPYELFLAWAILIVGWVLISRFPALWLVLLVLINISLILYWMQILDTNRWTFAGMCEAGFLLNAGTLVTWGWLAAPKIPWLNGRWIPRLLMCVAAAFLVIPTLIAIFEGTTDPFLLLAPLLYFGFIVACLWTYQRIFHDLFMLAACLLSLIVIITAFFMNSMGWEFGFLMFYSVLIIAQTAAAVFWLRHIEKSWGDSSRRA